MRGVEGGDVVGDTDDVRGSRCTRGYVAAGRSEGLRLRAGVGLRPEGQQGDGHRQQLGKAPHTFTAASVSVDEQIDAGQTKTVTFTMPASGSVAFVCKFHESQGMKGTISEA